MTSESHHSAIEAEAADPADVSADVSAVAAFGDFVAEVEPRLRRALISAYGAQVGRDCTADALGYAWEHWERVGSMANPAGYLYRVGQTAARRYLMPNAAGVGQLSVSAETVIEPALVPALRSLPETQRTAVLLVHGFEFTLREAAEVLGVSVSTLRNHLRRGLRTVRKELGVEQ